MKLVSQLANTITLGASKALKSATIAEAAKNKKQLKHEKEYFQYFQNKHTDK